MAKSKKINSKSRVICAMSGGVDSSVAVALLQKQGYEVIGAFMKFWHPPALTAGSENVCCSGESYCQAREVARHLGIRLYIFDFEKQFKKLVVDDFLRRSEQGLTPNPCVVCNEKIKFGLLLEKARQRRISLVATGHYAQIVPSGARVELQRGVDAQKDQSYFLYRLTPAQLKHVLFPVGSYKKTEVRALATRFGLPLVSRSESQEVCFVPNQDLRLFLKRYLALASGAIVTGSGQKIGVHQGLPIYTIGQRRGVVGGRPRPYFVLAKKKKSNELVVTDNPRELLAKNFTVADVTWLVKPERFPVRARVQIRYQAVAAVAEISYEKRQFVVRFRSFQRAITPGQSAVFYAGDRVLGGGVIKEVFAK